MRFYSNEHQFYCGVDLHARILHLCILDQAGKIRFHDCIKAKPGEFLNAVSPFRDDLVVGAECMFAWYWLADLCVQEEIPFLLGHALYMKAIHGGKSKSDEIDSHKIAKLIRGGMFPISYVYPKHMRATRDLLRRRTFLVRRRAELLAHIKNTHTQYNVPIPGGELKRTAKKIDLTKPFDDPSTKKIIEVDLNLVQDYDRQISQLELHLVRNAKVHDPQMFHRLQTIPGLGQVLALTMMYEIHDIRRFERAGQFLSYARLVRGRHVSAGKSKASPHSKIGNAHLKWAFSETTCLFIRQNEKAKKFVQRKARKQGGKGKALGILSAKLARAVYWMLRRGEAFDEDRFFAQ